MQPITTPAELQAALERRQKPTQLGAALIQAGLVTAEAVEQALQEQRQSPGKRLGEVLVEKGAVSTGAMDALLARQAGLLTVDVERYAQAVKPGKLIPAELSQRLKVLDLGRLDSAVVVASGRPLSADDVGMLRFALNGAPVISVLALDGADFVRRLLAAHPVTGASPFEHPQAPHLEGHADFQDANSAVSRFRQLLQLGLERGASDLHIHPQVGGNSQMQLRIDGHLHNVGQLDPRTSRALVRHIEALAGISLAKLKSAKEGRLTLRYQGHPLDLRISVIPAVEGDSVVCRLLDPRKIPDRLEDLRLPLKQEQGLRSLIVRPHGLFLLTGPTGSGKTTTLYTLLKLLARRGAHVITAEDPVEYRLAGVSQFESKDFANSLKWALRHDPDVIMVGELRDEASAQMAVNAALTGHLVLSTVHANNSLGALYRLLSLGISPSLLGVTLNGVLSQRLVRKLCQQCKGAGCGACDSSGYHGRQLLAEIARPLPSFSSQLAKIPLLDQVRDHTEFIDGLTLDNHIAQLARDGVTDWKEAASLMSELSALPEEVRKQLDFL